MNVMRRMFSMLMEGEGGAGGGGGAPAGGAPAGGAPAGSGGAEQTVPYSRFQEVNNGYASLKTSNGELQSKFDELNKKFEAQEAERQRLAGPDPEKEFYKDPHAAHNNLGKTMKEEMDRRFKELSESNKNAESKKVMASAIAEFRQKEGYTTELEEKVAAFIKEKGLGGIDPRTSLELAYNAVTGEGSGYIRKEKEGLQKPLGGGVGDPKLADELAKLDTKDPDYEKKMREIHSKMTKK